MLAGGLDDDLGGAGTVLAVSGPTGSMKRLYAAAYAPPRSTSAARGSRYSPCVGATVARPAVQREAPTATLSLVQTWFAIGPSR